MKNNRNKAWIAVLTALVLSLILTGCGKSNSGSRPEDTVAALETAINDLDTDGIVRCLNQELGAYVDALLNLPIGDGNSTVRRVLTFIKPLSAELMRLSDDPIQLTLEVRNVDVVGNTAEAETLARLTCGEYSKDVLLTIELELQNGRWVIGSLR